MRTIDADALLEKVEDHVTTVSCCPTADWSRGKTQMKEQIIEDIRNAPTIGGWISIQDRAPEGECIAYSAKWFEMIIGYIYKSRVSDTGYEAENEHETLRDVTHWMPKPEPPTGGVK